jgi:hypothetical protein
VRALPELEHRRANGTCLGFVLPDDDLTLGQAYADIATIGILQERAIHRREAVSEQLQIALSSRVIIEQAKGVFAQHFGISTVEAAPGASRTEHLRAVTHRRPNRHGSAHVRRAQPSGSGRWRMIGWGWDGSQLGSLVWPDQQHRAGGVVDHESGVAAQAAWPKPGVVAIAGTDQQCGTLAASDHLSLDSPGPDHATGRSGQPSCGGVQEPGRGLLGESIDRVGRVAASRAPSEQSP